jgi:AcrR family transcriptional regulator
VHSTYRLAALKQNVSDYNMATRTARKTASAYHHGDLRAALIAAATVQVERAGPESVSLNALAKQLDVSQAAPYRHFRSRDDLLAVVATDAFDRLNEEMRIALQRAPAQSKLKRAAHAYLRIGTENSGLYRLMYGSDLVDQAEVGSDLQVAVDAGFQIWLTAFEPSLPLATRERIALRMWVALHGVVTLTDQGFLPLKVRTARPEDVVEDIIRETKREIAAAMS